VIFEGSRYEHSDVATLLAANGQPRQTVLADTPRLTAMSFSYYVISAGDRIDLLADRFLGDPELWWVIADANPQHMYYDYLPDGTVLRIPGDIAAS
jgi:nucleoid-associated protein YgaU